MRRLFQLSALALAVWTAFVALLAVLGLMVAVQACHPHFLPVTAVLAVLVGGGLALLTGGVWRVIRGPGRLRAITCVLLGAAPLFFFTGHVLYGFKAGYGRQIEMNLPLRMLMPFGESIFDLLSRFAYPVRAGGETVVMIASPVANARDQVAAMDRHVRLLRKRLGDDRSPRCRVHWVRGSLLGIGGKAIHSMCLGSRPGELPVDADGLTSLDRHEVAHCVLSGFVSMDTDPPAVLSEGWAQASMGHDAKAVAYQAWSHREQGSALSLRELTGPSWYARHHWPVYVQGAALVNHILRVHGPAKFLELYATCRASSFADDCQRVLGVSLDRLDASYWAEVEQIVGQEDSTVARLRAMKVRPPVSIAEWNTFLDEYVAKTHALTAPYAQVRMTFELRSEITDAKGRPERFVRRTRVLRSAKNAAERTTYPESEEAWLATPERSFEARRPARSSAWEIEDVPQSARAATYRRALHRIASQDRISLEAPLLLALSEELRDMGNVSSHVVSRLERFDEEGHPLVRVRLDDLAPHPIQWRSVTIVLAADDSLAARTFEGELTDGSTLRGTLTYDHASGPCVLTGTRLVIKGRDGTSRTIDTTIVERVFGPVPETEFTEAKLLEGPVVHKPPQSNQEAYKDPKTFADHYWMFLIAGGVAIATGFLTGLLGSVVRSRARPDTVGGDVI